MWCVIKLIMLKVVDQVTMSKPKNYIYILQTQKPYGISETYECLSKHYVTIKFHMTIFLCQFDMD